MRPSCWARSAACLAILLSASPTIAASLDVSTPPPVSGRRLSDPGSILPADVLARVELLRANLDLVRRFVGRPSAPAPLLRVESAQPREVYSQALNLEAGANRLAFEQLRIVRAHSLPNDEARSVEVFGVMDSALEAVLLVKAELGVEEVVAEEPRPESTMASEVFNAAVAASSEIDNVLGQRTSPSDVFQLVTQAVHYASALHASLSDSPRLPVEPDFVPNKMPSDVYARMIACFELTSATARAANVAILDFETDPDSRRVRPNDVAALGVLLVEELSFLHSRVPEAKPAPRAYHPGLRFPAHAYQRAGLLLRILEDLAARGLNVSVGRGD